MTPYAWFLVGFVPAALGFSMLRMRSRRQFSIVLRVATSMVFLAYPWDYSSPSPGVHGTTPSRARASSSCR